MSEIIFFFGITLSIAGVVAASITESWFILSIILLTTGIILLIISLYLWGNKNQFWQKRSTKQSLGELTTTIIVLIGIGLINILAITNNIRWDLTENRLFTLSPQSQAIVSQLEQPLEVLVFDRNINPELEKLLQNYRRYGKQFKFKFVDPEQEIGLAQQYGVQSLEEIYLKYGNKKQKLNVNKANLSETITETQLTNGIEKIKRDRPVNIYLVRGHGEASLEFVEGGLAQAVKSLKDKGNNIQLLNLASNSVPQDANLVIVAGATRKLLAGEVSNLQNYMRTGGNLLLLLAPNTDIGISSLLSEWGIELDNRLVVDGSGASTAMGFGPAVAIVDDYGEHPITASFRHGISIFPESRPLKIQEKAGIESTPLAITEPQTWAESDLSSEEITFDSAKDLSGSLNIAVALSRNQPQDSRLVVFGSITFATNGWFEQQLNGDIFLNSVNWLVGEARETLAIRPKEAANRRINLSSLQSGIIAWLAIRIMPLMALIIGVLLWQKRR